MGVQIPGKGQIWGECGGAISYRKNGAKRLNRSSYTVQGGLSAVGQGIVYYVSVHTGATWQIQSNDCAR